MKIGIVSNNYPEKRCVINKVGNNVEYINLKEKKYNRYLASLEIKLLKRFSNKEYNFSTKISKKEVDLFHFFNHISYANNDFVVSFETVLPRVRETIKNHHLKEVKYPRNKVIEKGLKQLASPKCKKIISLSQCAFNIQYEMLKEYPEYKKQILDKMTVIHPPQRRLIDKYEDKQLPNNKIRFLFVGRELHLKGGREILEVFEDLSANYKEKVELILIGNLNSQYNHAFKNFQDSEEEKQKLLDIINENKNITHYQSLNNDEVLEIAKTSHVGLLPTWADTYGYSVLEMQAAGCPVISTNLRALPEINNNECGWIIKLPKNKCGELAIIDSVERDELRINLQKQMSEIFKAIIDDSEIIRKKGEKALERIKLEHNPQKYGETLNNIYIESIERD